MNDEIDAKEECLRWFEFDDFMRELKVNGLVALSHKVCKGRTYIIVKERAEFMAAWQAEDAANRHGYRFIGLTWIGQGTRELCLV